MQQKGNIMNKMNRYLAMSSMVALLIGGSAAVSAAELVAKTDPMYRFLPSDTVVDNVKNILQTHGVDAANIQVDADAQGVVQLSGEVGSKQDVETVTQLAKQADGVYAVLGALRYSTGEVVPAPVPAGLDPVMDAPAAGAEGVQPESEQIDAQ